MTLALSACVQDLQDIQSLIEQIACSGEGPVFFSTFIGPHIRHVIEHYAAFLDAASSGAIVTYDKRERNLAISEHPQVAIERIDWVIRELMKLKTPRYSGDATVAVEFQITANPESGERMGSTFAREIHFLMHHTIHHCAMIRLHCQHRGIPTSDEFGKAPATIGYEKLQSK